MGQNAHSPLIERPLIRTVRDAIRAASGAPGVVGAWQRENIATPSFARGIGDVACAQGLGTPLGFLWASKVRADGDVMDLGLVSARVVTTAGVSLLIDAMQGTADASQFQFHGVGTGSTAEAASNTALAAELSTQYQTSNTRPTGTRGEVSGQSNAYETSATVTVSANVAIVEHGLFNRAAINGGVLFDRSVFAVVNLAATESFVVTYQYILPAGG